MPSFQYGFQAPMGAAYDASPVLKSPVNAQARPVKPHKPIVITDPNTKKPVSFSKNTPTTPPTTNETLATEPHPAPRNSSDSDAKKKLFKDMIMKKVKGEQKKEQESTSSTPSSAGSETSSNAGKDSETAKEKPQQPADAAKDVKPTEEKPSSEPAAEPASSKSVATPEQPKQTTSNVENEAKPSTASTEASTETPAPSSASEESTTATTSAPSATETSDKPEEKIEEKSAETVTPAKAEEKATEDTSNPESNENIDDSFPNKQRVSPLVLLKQAARPSPAEVAKLTYPPDFKPPATHSKCDDVYLYDAAFILQFQGVVSFPPKEKWESIRSIINLEKSSNNSNYGKNFGRGGSSRGNAPGNQSMGNFNAGSMRGMDRSVSGHNLGSFHMSGKSQSRMGSSNNLAGGYKSGRQNSSRRGRNNERSGSNRGGNRDNFNNFNSKSTTNLSGMSSSDNNQQRSITLASGTTVNLGNSSSQGQPAEPKPVVEPPRSKNAWVPRIRSKQPAPEGPLTPEMVQREVKSLLNKMTLDNFATISDQLLKISEQSKDEKDGRTLRQIIELTFAKAVDEAHWSAMYARFSAKMLAECSPEIYDEQIKNEKGEYIKGGALFRKYLFARCQDEFQKGWSDKLPTNADGTPITDPDLMSEEYYAAAAAKRRGLGLIRFIGELFMLDLLTVRIIQGCIMNLVQTESPSEETIESLCKLLTTVGAKLEQRMAAQDSEKSIFNMDYAMQRFSAMKDIPDLPSRLKFMIMDVEDLRRNNWVGKHSNSGPKTVAEIHQEAEAQRLEQEKAHKKKSRDSRNNFNHGNQVNVSSLKNSFLMSRDSSDRGRHNSSSPSMSALKDSSRSPSQNSTSNKFQALTDDNDDK